MKEIFQFDSKKYGVITVMKLFTGNDYTYVTDKSVTENEARIIQEYVGYHPGGYGFYDYLTVGSSTMWTSFSKC